MTESASGPERPASQAVDAAASDPNQELRSLQAELQQLQAQGESGAHWFYWIAVLSLVSAVVALSGGRLAFVVGLGVTEIIRWEVAERVAERPELAMTVKAVALGFSLALSAVFAFLGWMANKRVIPVYALGMLLYLLDGLLYVFLQRWLPVAFHAFALVSMWQGLMAYRKLNAILRSQPAMT